MLRHIPHACVKCVCVLVVTVMVLLTSHLRQDGLRARHRATSPHRATSRPPHRPFTPSCRAMFTVEKGNQENGDILYEGLSHELEPLLEAVNVGDTATTNLSSILAYPATRLSLMDGALPYLPCKVRGFSALEVGECTTARSALGSSTWITFVGDSNQRQKIHSFITFLPRHLNYTYYLGDVEVTMEEFIKEAVHHMHRPPTFDIIGRRPSNATSSHLDLTLPHDPSTHTRTSYRPTDPLSYGYIFHSAEADGQKVPSSKYYRYILREATDDHTEGRKAKGNESLPSTDRHVFQDTTGSHKVKGTEVLSTPKRHKLQKTNSNHNMGKKESASEAFHTPKLKYKDATNYRDQSENEEVYKPLKESNVQLQGFQHSPKLRNNDATNQRDQRKNAGNDRDQRANVIYSKPLMENDGRLRDYELRVTLVWAPLGSEMGPPTAREGKRVTKLLELASTEAVPDVIVIGFGIWLMMMREHDEELVPFTEMDLLSRPLLQPLSTLASRTTVLLWPQSRFIQETRDEKFPLYPRESWQRYLYNNQFSDSLTFLDMWLWKLMKGTGAWYWDSTLPLNLANLRECQRLNQAGLKHFPVYKDRWWNCADRLHTSYETVSVEILMLLNLLCNEYLEAGQEYCCSGGGGWRYGIGLTTSPI